MVTFSRPLALLLLLVVPALVLLALRRPNPVALALRAAAVTALVLALAGIGVSTGAGGSEVVFVLDVSQSVGAEALSHGKRFIESALAGRREADQVSLVVFGAEPSVEGIGAIDLRDVTSAVDSRGSDLAAGIFAGMAALPRADRIVLLTDGNQTRGDAERAAAVASAAGVTVDVVPLSARDGSQEALVAAVTAPERLAVGQGHRVRVTVEAGTAMEATLTFLRDRRYLGEDRVRLQPGTNAFSYAASILEKGLHTYEVFLDVATDGFPENNYAQTVVQVSAEPAILLVNTDGEPSANLMDALAVQGYTVAATDELPDTLAELMRWDLVVFDNVPAYDLSFEKMDLIETYVRGTGGGFLMLGGDASFGAGGYYKTPIGDLLPVDVDVTSSLTTPSLTMVMVVDKSGSMGGAARATESKLDIVKEAALSAIDVLNPFYTVGLLAFDADTEWTVPVVAAGERSRIVQRLSTLSSGGGTRLYPALEEAARELARSRAAVKHVLVLSDGLTDDGDFRGLVGRMAEDGITVSTVAVGEDANRDLMRDLAEWGGGRSYFADRIEETPRIFASESLTVSRDLTVEETFLPSIQTRGEILQGVGELPPLHGFVLAYNKPGAIQLLSTFQGNPLLSVWQYGLGRTAAFTSDLKGRWGRDWLPWSELPRFAAQLARWTQRASADEGLQVRVTAREESALVTVEARDPAGGFANGLDLRAMVVGPDGAEATPALEQDAPGRYTTSFPLAGDGLYFVTFTESRGTGLRTAALAVPCPREFARFGADLRLLRRIAAAGGGRVLDQPSGLFDRPTRRSPEKPVVWLSLVVALALFFADIVVRLAPLDALVSVWAALVRLLGRDARATSYRQAREQIVRRREEEAARRRDLSFWFGRDAEKRELSARLYIARRRRDRSAGSDSPKS